MAKKRIFISFDFDNDESLRNLFAGQAKLEDSPFDFTDHSNKKHLLGDWRAKTLSKVKGCDAMAVMCGQKMQSADGVTDEIEMAREAGVPYFCIAGYADKDCYFPKGVTKDDKLYKWTWPNVKALINGDR